MHTYWGSSQGWAVGYAEPDSFVLREFSSEIEAAGYVNYLNGGDGKPWHWFTSKRTKVEAETV